MWASLLCGVFYLHLIPQTAMESAVINPISLDDVWFTIARSGFRSEHIFWFVLVFYYYLPFECEVVCKV